MLEAIEKLREFVNDQFVSGWETHSQGMAIANSIEAEIAERYILLPVDAVDEPIRIGDTIARNDMAIGPIDAIMIRSDGLYEVFSDGNGWEVDEGSDLHFAKPETLVDILAEFGQEVFDKAKVKGTFSYDCSAFFRIEERYADRIRKLLGGDAE